jgi:hypothetical protein
MAAGLGYKEFSTGDVLTAADANGYLASQVVMVFASAAARTSAIASPQEGMISYLKDTNAVEKYDGSAWVSVGGGGGGKVLQVVNVVHTTSVTTSSATLADTGLTATITPSLSTSKVLVLVNHNGVGKGGNLAGRVRLMRGASQILLIDSLLAYTGSTAELYVGGIGATYLDSPATTSATTYKTQFASDNGATFAINTSGGGLGSSSTITLIEIGA